MNKLNNNTFTAYYFSKAQSCAFTSDAQGHEVSHWCEGDNLGIITEKFATRKEAALYYFKVKTEMQGV